MEEELRRWHAFLRRALRGEAGDDAPPLDGLSLLSADTDRIQEFVFQSARLPEIRGASTRLDRLNWHGDNEAEQDPPRDLRDVLARHGLETRPINDDDRPGCVVFAGGGSLMAVVPRRLAPTLAAEIEALYPTLTDVATITAVHQPVSPADLAGRPPAGLDLARVLALEAAAGPARARWRLAYGLRPYMPIDAASIDADAFARAQGLGRVMLRQMTLLRRRKQDKDAAPLVEADPYTRRCRSCGRRPAVATRTLAGEPPRFLCAVCHENGRIGGGAKSLWNAGFDDWYYHTHGISLGESYAKDLGDIGADSLKKGFVGYIYADGNSIGRLLESAPSLVDYSERSQRLSETMREAVFAALARHLVSGLEARRFEIITIGGDDALLIVPAHAALPIAVEICRAFSAALADLAPGGAPTGDAPTMSAGVVLAKDDNPVYFLHDLARQLLKRAKTGAQRTGAGTIDFMVLKSQSTVAVSLDHVRTSGYLQVANERSLERCLLTGRPYTLDETDRLLRGVQALAQVRLSRGQLHQMREAFRRGRLPGLFHYVYQRMRLGDDVRGALTALEADWELGGEDDVSPWRAYPPGRESTATASDGYLEFDTPLLDMLELGEFVTEADDEN